MNFAAILAIVEKAVTIGIQVAPTVFSTIENLQAFAAQFAASLKNTPVTPEEQLLLEARIDALSAELQKPLDPE